MLKNLKNRAAEWIAKLTETGLLEDICKMIESIDREVIV